MFLLFLVALVMMVTTAQLLPSAQQPTSVLFVDFSLTSMTPAVVATAMDKFISQMQSNNVSGASRFQQRPVIVDTQGSLLNTVIGINTILNLGIPQVIFFAGLKVAEIQTLQSVLINNASTANIPLISLLDANDHICDSDKFPSTVCITPADVYNIRAALELSFTALNWQSAGVIVSNSLYGQSILSNLGTAQLMASQSPTIVTRATVPSPGNPAADDAFVRQLKTYNPVGVLAFVSPDELIRMYAAQQRTGITLFWIASKTAANILPQLPGWLNTVGSDEAMWGALLLPCYAEADDLVKKNYLAASSQVDEIGSMILSGLLDALRLTMSAPIVSAASILSTVVPAPTFTCASVAFDAGTSARLNPVYMLLTNRFRQDHAIASWAQRFLSDDPIVGSTTSTRMIPPSPLRAVQVCMLAAPACADIANLNRILYSFLSINVNRSQTSPTIVPVPLSTGYQGVDGLTRLLPIARSCTFVTGPGRSNVNYALSSILNEFNIPQLDYTSGGADFSNKLRFPSFSRTIPSDRYTMKAIAEACDYFIWERVIVITTNDEYGASLLAAIQAAMDEKTILVERVYKLDALDSGSVRGALTSIREQDISRIVIPLLPATVTDAAVFFGLVSDLQMTTSHIFLLNDALCQFSFANPARRATLISSICAAPSFDPISFNNFQTAYSADTATMALAKSMLQTGGFDLTGCDLIATDPYSAFAVDAAQLLISVINDANTIGISSMNSTGYVSMIRGRTLTTGVTSPFKLNALGDRDYAVYTLNIQQASGVTTFGFLDTNQKPQFNPIPLSAPIQWLDNTTVVPRASTRSNYFIAAQTVGANPGTIALSILGFIGTIAVFVFCYRHYNLQLELEKITLNPTH